MKKIIMFYGAFMVMIAMGLVYQGCSELDNGLTVTPDLDTHPDGWSNPSSNNFHGSYIFNNKLWNLNQCKTCHGADYKGGNTNSSCLGCHSESDGPENCSTCHGNSDGINPPKALNGDTSSSYIGVGMHYYHLQQTNWSAPVACTECHNDITGFNDPNHLGASPDGIAEIVFGTLANNSLGGVTPNPQWDRNNATCSGSYCHGSFPDGNQNSAAIWTDMNSVKCGSCHGDPNTGNPTPRTNGVFTPPHYSFMTQTSCYVCHGSVINGQGQFVDKNKHVNGQVDY
jgi:predicted CxxxxCH...CXXCH cytochrome family protein